jgi:hypothetical protein
MTAALLKYAQAHEQFEALVLRPAENLLTASAEAVKDANGRATAAHDMLETMRPVWAQGFTSDSMAAQATSAALAQMWKALGVTDQTAAMAAIRKLQGNEG